MHFFLVDGLCLVFVFLSICLSQTTQVTRKMSGKSKKMIQSYLGCRIEYTFYNLRISRTYLFLGKFSTRNLLFLSFKLRKLCRRKLTAFTKTGQFSCGLLLDLCSIKREHGSAGLWRPTHLLDMNHTSRKH